jgi:hypothetical protein
MVSRRSVIFKHRLKFIKKNHNNILARHFFNTHIKSEKNFFVCSVKNKQIQLGFAKPKLGFAKLNMP